jgi:hypothetical protein
VGSAIHGRASESIQRSSESQIEGDSIGIDGLWDHRRNGSLCIVGFRNNQTGQVIDFEDKMKKKQYVRGNVLCTEPLNNVEKLVVEALVAGGWTIIEALDPEYAKKSMEKQIEEWSRKHHQLFREIS